MDLNFDEKIDYIRVIDYINGNAHIIVLRVNINEYESQDVAVIEVEKINRQIRVQIIGDEKLYGKDYIVGPNDQLTYNPGYDESIVIRPVSSWIIFSYIYSPYYITYSSPYYWGYYPYYWNTWAPIYYSNYYNYHRHFYNYYRRGYYYHSPAAHNYYMPNRVTTTINGYDNPYKHIPNNVHLNYQNRPNNMNHPSNYPNHPSNYPNHPSNYLNNRPNNYNRPPTNQHQNNYYHQQSNPSSSPNHSRTSRKTR